MYIMYDYVEGEVGTLSVRSCSCVERWKKVGRSIYAQREVGTADHGREEAGESGRRVSVRRRGREVVERAEKCTAVRL
jgi:hypothetical protein